MTDIRSLKNKFYLMTAIVVLALSFSACDKNNDKDNFSNSDDTKANSLIVEATVGDYLGSEPEIATVKAIIVEKNYQLNNIIGYEVGSSNYKNDSFKLTLGTTIPDQYLRTVPLQIVEGGVVITVTVNNPNAKITSGVIFVAYNSQEQQIGIIMPMTKIIEYKTCTAGYVYADRNCTVNYKENGEDKWSVSYKKGWNITYIDSKIDQSVSEKPPYMTVVWTFLNTTNM